MTFLEHLATSDEAEMIREAATRFATSVDDAAIRASDGFDGRRWEAMAELGWHGLMVDGGAGGLDLGMSEVALLAGAIGAARLPEPYIANSVAAVAALNVAGGRLAGRLLRGIAEGRSILAPAGFGLPCDAVGDGLTAQNTGDGVTFDGEVALCEAGPITGSFLVYAEREVPVLACLERDMTGLGVTPCRAIDGRHLARLVLSRCAVGAETILARGEAARTAVRKANAAACAALCADAVGTMDRAIALSVEYLNEREQFGRKLASFQALRHMVADLTVEAELARSMAVLAAFAVDRLADPAELLDRARARICRAARQVGQTAIQLHGGMGMTDELAIGHYFRRLIYLQAMLGQEAGALRARAATLAAEIGAHAGPETAE